MCNYRRLILFHIVILLIGISCKPQKTNLSLNNERKYYEDLSYIRSTEKTKTHKTTTYVEDTIQRGINEELDSIINIIKYESNEINSIDGYTIQIYLGDDRSEAEKAEKKLNAIDSLIERKTVFTQPNYRVKVGQYYDRFKVNKDYNRLKKEFRDAIIIPQKIKIN
tara:strand:+ start:446 stop:943 length:498 start_codon:yes stop_codon:yes gene_type:complete